MKPPVGAVVALVLTTALTAMAQPSGAWRSEEDIGQPFFDMGVFVRLTQNPDSGRFDVVVEIPYDLLQFVRRDTTFSAEVELSFFVVDSKGSQRFRRVKTLRREVASYALTNSRRNYLKGTFSATLPFGDYTVRVVMVDRESRRRHIASRDVTLEPIPPGAGVALSDLMWMLSSEIDTATGAPVNPTLNSVLPDKSTRLYCLFDLYSTQPGQPSRVDLTVFDRKGEVRSSEAREITPAGELTTHIMPVPLESLAFSRYKVTLAAVAAAGTASRSADLQVRYFGLPGVIQDINQAIQQLKYITGEKEIQRLLNDFPSRKEEAFLDFWDRVYPTPGETVNGKMVEYYNRIEYANSNFSDGGDGWDTDRGRILVIYGKPAQVERYASEDQSTNYEVWYYNNLNKRFVFRDDYGFGEYRLVTPAW